MAGYTKLTEEEINELGCLFGISPIGNFSPMDGGAANSSFLIQTTDDSYVLSVCDEKSFKEAENLAALLCYLEKNEFPTTRLVLSKEGKGVVNYENKPVILKKFIQGRICRQPNNIMLRQLGGEIGKLHKIPAPLYLPPVFPYGVDFFSEIISSGLNPEYGRWLEEKQKHFRSCLSPDLPRGLVHSDIFYDNVIFQGNQGNLDNQDNQNNKESCPAAIIDFEEASNYYLIFDLGMSIVGTCTEGGNISLPKAGSLVGGYQSERRLSSLEKESLQSFAEYGAAATSFWRFRQYNLIYPDENKAKDYEEMMELARQINSIEPDKFIKEIFFP